ncbi:hypothetical protein PFISCL1PPCAC_4059, partial [Pristionchus fissidentatus]
PPLKFACTARSDRSTQRTVSTGLLSIIHPKVCGAISAQDTVEAITSLAANSLLSGQFSDAQVVVVPLLAPFSKVGLTHPLSLQVTGAVQCRHVLVAQWARNSATLDLIFPSALVTFHTHPAASLTQSILVAGTATPESGEGSCTSAQSGSGPHVTLCRRADTLKIDSLRLFRLLSNLISVGLQVT